MHRLKCQQVGDNMVYQWYLYNPTTYLFEICTDYNDSVIICGEEYTPVNGSFTIPIDIMADIPMTLCQMHCELNDIRQDLRDVYGHIMTLKGWLGNDV